MGGEHAGGEWVSFIDADDTMFPERLWVLGAVALRRFPRLQLFLHTWSRSRAHETVTAATLNESARWISGTQLFDTAQANEGRQSHVLWEIMHSQASVRREVLRSISFRVAPEYRRKEDSLFVRDVIRHTGREDGRVAFANVSLGWYVRRSQQRKQQGVAPPCQLPIVSMASSNHFKQLLGSLGSIQHNEPTRHVAVFDIGLTALEAHHLAALSPRVRLLRFPFHNYPAHVRISQSRKGLNYAFQLLQKELALSMLADGRLKFPEPCCSDSVLFLDASIEVRPVGLAEIDRIVQAQGYFLTLQGPTLFEHTPDAYFAVFGSSKKAVSERFAVGASTLQALQQVSGGINAMRLDSALAQQVLKPAAACARRYSCMVPNVSLTGEKNCCWSQGLLSAGAYTFRLRIHGDRRFWHASTHGPTPSDDVLLTMRAGYNSQWRLGSPRAQSELTKGVAKPKLGSSHRHPPKPLDLN